MRAIWINRAAGKTYPSQDYPQPDATLPNLAGLPALLRSLDAAL